jgi:hypothetical protein
MQYRGKSGFVVLLSASLLLSACGSDDEASTSSNGNTNISGTAARGAAMTSGTVELSCKDGLKKSGIAISATGTWSSTVPTVNLPCAVKATDGSNTYYSFTVGNGSSIVSNVTPLTTLALAQILGATPASLFATLSATDLAKLNSSAINAAISALNTALANYALPANFNPVTTPLTAATTTQGGNAYDGLLDQFSAALGATTLDSLISDAATGTLPSLPTPSYTSGAANLGAFFTTFAGDYTLTVNNSGAEGTNNAAVIALFPQDRAITVHLKSNGDVSIDGVGRTITYLASTYAGNSTGTSPIARTDFAANESGKNVLRYRSANGSYLDLYLTYDPSNGKLELSPQAFVNNEGYASLRGSIVAPPAVLPPPVAAICTAGDDKLVFTNGPTDFCGFTRSASANSIDHYYQFTSTAGSHGVTYVKFEMNSDDTVVEKVTIENDAYAFGCGGAFAACGGATVSSGSSYRQFTLSNTTLAVINGASQALTVNGLLIHPVASTGGGDTPTGPLGAALQNVYAGDYTLKCSTQLGPDAAAQTYAVTINADGSSTLDGQPLLDSTHPGRYSLSRSSNGSTGLEIRPDAANSNYVALGFNADGSFFPNSVFSAGSLRYCFSNSGHTAPASSAQAHTVHSSAASAFARTANLSCSQNGNADTRSLSIGSDGSAQLGTLSFTVTDISLIVHDFPSASAGRTQLGFSVTSGGYRGLNIYVNDSLQTTSVSAAAGLNMADAITCTP